MADKALIDEILSYIKKLADELAKIKKEAQISLNILILGWSVTLGAYLFAMPKITVSKGAQSASIIYFLYINNDYFLILAPMYVLAVWIAGCAVIILAHRYLLGRK